jgi:hypothetical protein
MQNNEFCFLFEVTSQVSPSKVKIIDETVDENGSAKIVFETILQTANERNGNRRIYSRQICESIVKHLTIKTKQNSLMMEIDHPMFVSDSPETLKKRAAVVEINNCAAKLRKVFMRGNDIIGEVESLTGFRGPDFANLVARDKVNIGFSLRALGSVEPLTDGTLMVKEPIRPITYDIVSNPSHANARILKFLPENSNEFLPDDAISLMESVGELEQEQLMICEGGICVRKFVDEIINETFLDVVSKNVKFMI